MSTWYPHSTVATVVEQDGRFLLVYERADGAQVYNQPAGHLEAGEGLVQAAIRETLEETGWEVEVTGLVAISLYTAPANGVTYHRTTFCARPLRHWPQRPLDCDIIAAEWLTLAEMEARAEQMRSPMVLAAVRRFQQGMIYPLDIIHEAPL